jgi:hypothetical protein
MTQQLPSEFLEYQQRQILQILNTEAGSAYREIVRAMPVGVGGELQRSWIFIPGSLGNPTAIIGSSSSYFLPVEMGRVPGKGVSREGQESIQLWARRKLSMSPQESRGFAYLLSEKYKREGRGAQGLIGLAAQGSQGSQIPSELAATISGSILHKLYQELERKLS